MGSFGNSASNADAASSDKENRFRKLIRQRLMGSEDCFARHRVLGQYYVAAMLFIVVTIYIWCLMSIMLNTFDGVHYESAPFYTALKNSTAGQTTAIICVSFIMEMCIQIPGALLIYVISSHKFLTAAAAISSVIHMLTPLAMNYSSLCVVIWAQKLVMGPFRIAVLSMWKDWAPPPERKKFVILSLFSWIFLIPILHFFEMIHYESIFTKANFYVTGICGLVWSLLWFFTVSDTPANDSQSQQNKQICLQNNTLSIFKGMPKLSEVPWKSILTSMPVVSLCLLYFKLGIFCTSLDPLPDVTLSLPEERLGYQRLYYQLLFMSLYIVVFFISALITDFLTKKYPGMIKTRKMIIFGALILHAILLLGTFIHDTTYAEISKWMSIIILSTSFTGIFTNALDLSSQYVSIISGFIETSFLLGLIFIVYIMQYVHVLLRSWQFSNSGGIVPYFDIGFTIIVAVVFYIWGSLEEQPWSLNHSCGQENANPQSYALEEEHDLKGTVPQNTLM